MTTAYLIAATITTPLYGKLSDHFRPSSPVHHRIGIFVIGSLLSSFATSMYRWPRSGPSKVSVPAA